MKKILLTLVMIVCNKNLNTMDWIKKSKVQNILNLNSMKYWN